MSIAGNSLGMDNARRTRDNRAFLEWIEEDRIHHGRQSGFVAHDFHV